MLNIQAGTLYLAGHNPHDLVNKFGSPLYVYHEDKLKENCRILKKFCGDDVAIHYSTKANSTIALLKLIRSQGILADAMGLGELHLLRLAGYSPDEILFMSNNVHTEDLKEVLGLNLRVCLDSLDELEFVLAHGGDNQIYIRVNNGITAGHSKNVQTAGAVKFGIETNRLAEAFKLAEKYNRTIDGFCTHIGSFFLNYDKFHQNVVNILELAARYPTINYIDFGGGFGVPYDRRTQSFFPFDDYGPIFRKTLADWKKKHRPAAKFGIQPGRFIMAEAGVCIATVCSVKTNYNKKFIGTDIGFNFFPRPFLYGGYHEILPVIETKAEHELAFVTGNLCESGDLISGEINLAKNIKVGDKLILRDAGAYSFSMASNYTAMPRPAEVLIKSDNSLSLIRNKEQLADLARGQNF